MFAHGSPACRNSRRPGGLSMAEGSGQVLPVPGNLQESSGLVRVGHAQVLVPGTPCGNMSETGPHRARSSAWPQTGSRASFHPVGLLFLHSSSDCPRRLSTWLISIPEIKSLGSQKGKGRMDSKMDFKISLQACWTWHHVSAVLSHGSQRQRVVLSLRPVWAVCVYWNFLRSSFDDNTTDQ